jgi:hypothetical protein
MPASLAQMLDLVADRARLRPAEVIEKLLEEHPSGHDQLLPVSNGEPLTHKRTFRLSPKAYSRLLERVEKHSTVHPGDGPDVSEAIRRLLVSAFTDLGIWVVADAPGPQAPSEEIPPWPASTAGALTVVTPLWQTGGWVGKFVSVLFLLAIAFLPVLAMRMPDANSSNPLD